MRFNSVVGIILKAWLYCNLSIKFSYIKRAINTIRWIVLMVLFGGSEITTYAS